MSFSAVKAHAMTARAEKEMSRKLDAIACALEELANALAKVQIPLTPSPPDQKKRSLFT